MWVRLTCVMWRLALAGPRPSKAGWAEPVAGALNASPANEGEARTPPCRAAPYSHLGRGRRQGRLRVRCHAARARRPVVGRRIGGGRHQPKRLLGGHRERQRRGLGRMGGGGGLDVVHRQHVERLEAVAGPPSGACRSSHRPLPRTARHPRSWRGAAHRATRRRPAPTIRSASSASRAAYSCLSEDR